MNHEIFEKIYNNYIDYVRDYIANGHDLNIVNEAGSTMLIYATYWRRKEIQKMLIEAGAKQDIQNNNGYYFMDYERHLKQYGNRMLW